MPTTNFYQQLKDELTRIDHAKTSKRFEKIIEGFTEPTTTQSPRAIISGKEYLVFNSNDYLGLRHHPKLKLSESEASEKYGTGPGAVRFISGSLKIHRELERAIASFHNRDDAIVFSSAFATNMATLFSLIKGQSKDTVVNDSVLVISDELNHRSIIDGIRVANHAKDRRTIFKHLNAQDLATQLEMGLSSRSSPGSSPGSSSETSCCERALVVTDGVFSMLGEYQNLHKIRQVVDEYDKKYPSGVLLVVDDAHGVGAFGHMGRGTEEVSGAKADILVGTLGKAFGADGGYVVANQTVIDYLRESAATYIYSNSISPGTAGASLAALELMSSSEGQKFLEKLESNVSFFKKLMKKTTFQFASDSIHPIQPILIGDPQQTSELVKLLFKQGILVTMISYPVVPFGRDEIRVQLSAAHTKEDIEQFVEVLKQTERDL